MKNSNVIRLVTEKKKSGMDRKEIELIECIASGDEKAFKELYLLYYSRLSRFITKINGGQSLDEIINDVMYIVWQKSDTYNKTSMPSTWIFGIAFNKIRHYQRGAYKDLGDSIDEMESESIQFGAMDAGINQLEMNDLFEEAFKSLSADQRAVVELTYFQGMSYQEIAQIMECSENTIKTRMFHARNKLSKTLQRLEVVPEFKIK